MQDVSELKQKLAEEILRRSEEGLIPWISKHGDFSGHYDLLNVIVIARDPDKINVLCKVSGCAGDISLTSVSTPIVREIAVSASNYCGSKQQTEQENRAIQMLMILEKDAHLTADGRSVISEQI